MCLRSTLHTVGGSKDKDGGEREGRDENVWQRMCTWRKYYHLQGLSSLLYWLCFLKTSDMPSIDVNFVVVQFIPFRLFVVLKTRIQVFSFPKDPNLLFYFDTKENPKGTLFVIITRDSCSSTVYCKLLDSYLKLNRLPFNPLTLKIWFSILPSSCYIFPSK